MRQSIKPRQREKTHITVYVGGPDKDRMMERLMNILRHERRKCKAQGGELFSYEIHKTDG